MIHLWYDLFRAIQRAHRISHLNHPPLSLRYRPLSLLGVNPVCNGQHVVSGRSAGHASTHSTTRGGQTPPNFSRRTPIDEWPRPAVTSVCGNWLVLGRMNTWIVHCALVTYQWTHMDGLIIDTTGMKNSLYIYSPSNCPISECLACYRVMEPKQLFCHLNQGFAA